MQVVTLASITLVLVSYDLETFEKRSVLSKVSSTNCIRLSGMPRKTITFKLSSRLSELETLNKKIDTFGVQVGLPDKCIFEIRLVLEELFTNISYYGSRNNKNHWVNVSMSCENDIMTIQIEDDGIPFNPLDLEKPHLYCDLEDRDIGGLGIYLVKHYTKECVYERRGNNNVLILKKTIGSDLSDPK